MSDAGVLDARSILQRIAVSLTQGALLWWLYDAVESGLWTEQHRGWLVGLIAVAVLVPMAHYLFEGLAPASRQGPFLAGLALALFGLGWYCGAWTLGSPGDAFPSFPAALVVLLFHALPFVQSALTRGRVRPHYADLFQFAWRNTLLVVLGFVFAGVFWLLLALWGALFHMLGIDVFRDLFTSSPFAIPATAVAVGTGVQLAGSVERLQTALRQQLLAMLKWLAPLAMLILVLFTVALLVKSPELFSEHRRAISAAWLLWLVAFTVALLNAAYQDGSGDAPYPRWLGTVIRLATVLLLPVALLAIYAIGVRVDAYGLTVARAWGLLVAVVALAYAGGYAWAALRRGAWMSGIGTVNVAVAVFTIAALTAMLTPLLAPERLAAASLYQRILAKPDTGSYAYLRFESGRYGRERLEQLARIEGHPAAADIRARAGREIRKKLRWDGGRDAEPLEAGDFEVFPSGARLDAELLAAFRAGPEFRVLQSCTPDDPVRSSSSDLDRDGSPEAIVFAQYGVAAPPGTARNGDCSSACRRSVRRVSFNDADTVRRALTNGRYHDRRVALAGDRDQRRVLPARRAGAPQGVLQRREGRSQGCSFGRA